MYKFILTTGGTGGHIFPALAVAESLRENFPDCEILFIGANYGLERELAMKASIKFIGLNAHGILGKGFAAPLALLHLLSSIPKAIKIIKEFKPDCTVGFGNYASFAAIIASQICNIPTILHEQNAIPGTTNKICSKFAKKICLSLPNTEGFNSKKCILTGNPIRKEICQITFSKRQKKCTRRLLVLGGSLGARALNKYICDNLSLFKENNIEIIHQTGQKEWEKVFFTYARHNYHPKNVKPFISKMSEAYAWADLILCRAGASTVAEICAVGLPAILVPFPHAIHDHQTQNAKFLEKIGGAILVPEENITQVGELVIKYLKDSDGLLGMSKNILKLARPDAANNVVAVIKSVIM